MNKLLVLISASLVITLVPGHAAAAPCNPEPSGSEVLGVTLPDGSATYYLADSGLWQESNGHAGLQESAGSCPQRNHPDLPIAFDADTTLLPA
jgi:hypothetical protein